MYAGIVALLMAQAKFVFSDAPAATPVPGLITRLHTTQAQVARWFTLFDLFGFIASSRSLTSFGDVFDRGRKQFGLPHAVFICGRKQLKKASHWHQDQGWNRHGLSIRRSGCRRDWTLHKLSTWVFYSNHSRTLVHFAVSSLRPIGWGRAYVLKHFFVSATIWQWWPLAWSAEKPSSWCCLIWAHMEPYYNIIDCFTSDSMPIGFGFWLKSANRPWQSRAGQAGRGMQGRRTLWARGG